MDIYKLLPGFMSFIESPLFAAICLFSGIGLIWGFAKRSEAVPRTTLIHPVTMQPFERPIYPAFRRAKLPTLVSIALAVLVWSCFKAPLRFYWIEQALNKVELPGTAPVLRPDVLPSANNSPQSTAMTNKRFVRPQHYPRNLTNSQLRENAERIVGDLNELVKRAKSEERQAEEKYRQPGSVRSDFVSSFSASTDNMIDEYNAKYRSEAQLLRDEIISRLPQRVRTLDRTSIEHTYQNPTNPLVCLMSPLI